MTEIDAMPYDADVLSRVLDDNDVPPKRLAHACGFHNATIYRHLAGERTLPSIVLRRAFELTLDLRLVALISGRIPITILQLPSEGQRGTDAARTVRTPPLSQLLEETCAAVEHTAKAVPYMGKILKDGNIDGADRAAIENFKQHAADASRCLAQVTAALDQHLAKAGVA